jgi:hypothetical protein
MASFNGAARIVVNQVVRTGQETEEDAVADAVAGQRRARRHEHAEQQERRERDAQ